MTTFDEISKTAEETFRKKEESFEQRAKHAEESFNEMCKGHQKGFETWLQQFIRFSGHGWGMGFYVELNDGRVLYNGTDEYRDWYASKMKEYMKIF